MFSFVTWPLYFTYLVIAVSLYYLFIWIVIYKGKLPSLGLPRELRTVSMYHEDSPDEVLTTAQHIIDELRPVFTQGDTKNQLILALQLHLHKYAAWQEPAFRDTVNVFIVSESQSKCSIHLSEEDQRELWL